MFGNVYWVRSIKPHIVPRPQCVEHTWFFEYEIVIYLLILLLHTKTFLWYIHDYILYNVIWQFSQIPTLLLSTMPVNPVIDFDHHGKSNDDNGDFYDFDASQDHMIKHLTVQRIELLFLSSFFLCQSTANADINCFVVLQYTLLGRLGYHYIS